MATDKDIKQDMEEAYTAGQSHWATYWQEAKYDIQFRNGKPDAKDEAYLKSQDRELLVFRKCHRIVNTVTGYEQKNLMALRALPIEGADDDTASQFSGLMMYNMLYGGGYMAQSGAFEFGPVVAGMNLLETWVDHSEDLLNGDIRFRRLPYNRFVLDPAFQDRNLDIDCSYIITRDYFTKQQCAGLIPGMSKDILKMKGSGSDAKFSYFYPARGKGNEYNLKYDRFYVKTERPYKIIADRSTGRMIPITNKSKNIEEVIRLFMQRFPQLAIIDGTKRGVDLHIFVENQLVYSGMDFSRIDEYPFVLEAGYWSPEDDDPKYRMQGLTRCMRDPGKEVNRRRSQVIDMLDAVIRQGWKVKDGSVVNNDVLYQGGFAVVAMKQQAEMTDAEQLQAPNIPAGVFQAMAILDKDHDEIAGVNSEMLGAPENEDVEVAAILAALRSANGLTTLQSLFNGHRFAKQILGRKQIRMMQKNFTPAKVQRILGEPPAQEFYSGEFSKYDCITAEAVLTDTQRQRYYAQLMTYKKLGMPVTWSQIIEYGPMEFKNKFKQDLAQQEMQQQKAMAEQQQMDLVSKQLLQAQQQYTLAGAHQKLTQSVQDQAAAVLDRAKATKELQNVDLESFAKTLQLLQVILNMMQGSTQPQGQALPGGQLQNMKPIGSA